MLPGSYPNRSPKASLLGNQVGQSLLLNLPPQNPNLSDHVRAQSVPRPFQEIAGYLAVAHFVAGQTPLHPPKLSNLRRLGWGRCLAPVEPDIERLLWPGKRWAWERIWKAIMTCPRISTALLASRWN